ncbi:FAD-dependent oxidoreductase [Blastomonas sp. UPD001]|jgi:fumarate reductase flavoprotein subunit|uniref:FAD-dependent oxidoreductase n=1 Tax=Blastomonas sp. UPD001 TaxID=2217673 RepID=UPI000E34E072|nr:FAD-dependent oxidoreductase [Blastomonas sp. UPD001]MBL0965737.1 FAD-dependent oxidoreductase [Blastomonas sp.]
MIPDFEHVIPVLVVGGGACGSIAALAARQAGAQVLVVEQDERPMGSTGMSQGLICAAGTRAQATLGIEDSADGYFADIMAKTRGQADPVLARAIADHAGPTVDWMVEALDMPWELDTGFRPAYGNSTFRVHGWRGHGGQDMVDLLHRRMDDAGIDVLLGTRLADVHADTTGCIHGVTLERRDRGREQVGCQTLILACGGFAANHALVAQHIPEMAHARNNGHEGSQGTGIAIASKLGAALGDMGAYQGYGMLTQPQGITVPPGVPVEGGILVNVEGRRFVNEVEDIAGMVRPVLAQPGDHVWVIFDERIEAATAYIPETQQLKALNAMRKADSIEELAALTDLPADALAATLAEAHAAQASGTPDAFGRVWGGDLPPLSPFRALRVVGAIYHTQGGLQIDASARVLRPDGTPLPNLFAGGGAARSVSGPAHWGYLPAMGLATAVTFGRLAGQAAAALVCASADR